MNDAEQVREFTEQSTGNTCPDKPVAMSRDAVLFIIRMVLSEMDELASTVCHNEDDVENLLKSAMESRDRSHRFEYTEVSKIASQFDAMVDSWYYMLNTSAKHGCNLSNIFNIVHHSNMMKRDPVSGKFIRRDDGKIMKPSSWLPPDVESEILRQEHHGSWDRNDDADNDN